MRFMLLLILIVFLGSAIADGAQSVSAWRGQSANMLIKDWGSPDIKISQPNGNAIFIYQVETYKNYNTQYSPAVGVNVTSEGRPLIVTPSMSPYSSQGMSLTCIVKFIVNKSGIIINTVLQGAGCQSDRIHP